MPHHQKFKQDADQTGGKGSASDAERQRQASPDGEDCDIGAAHDELAMGEVDDAHHAEDDRQPARRQDKEREGVPRLIEECEKRA